MKRMSLCVAAIVSLLSVSVLFAADKPTTKPVEKAAINKFCAVEGGDHTVDPEFFTMYKGMKIGFCCKDCVKSFDEDPDKYVAALKARKDGVK